MPVQRARNLEMNKRVIIVYVMIVNNNNKKKKNNSNHNNNIYLKSIIQDTSSVDSYDTPLKYLKINILVTKSGLQNIGIICKTITNIVLTLSDPGYFRQLTIRGGGL